MSEVYEIADHYVRRVRRARSDRRDRRGHRRPRRRAHRLLPRRRRRTRSTSTATRSPRSRTRRRHRRRDRIAADVMTRTPPARGRPARRGRGAPRRCGSSAARCRRSAVLRPHGLRHRRRLGDRAAARMARVPDALASFEASLREGIAAGCRRRRAARRSRAPQQAATWGGEQPTPFFARSSVADPGRRRAARRAGPQRGRGDAAYAALARFLRDEYAPVADPRDPVGRERYALFAARVQRHRPRSRRDVRVGMGGALPHRGRDAQLVGERILPGEPVARGHRPSRPRPQPHDRRRREFQRWNQELIDPTIAELNGTHFDIAEPLRRCEAMIAPPGGAAAMYYTGPSEDFSPARPHVVPDAWATPASRSGAR